MNRAWAEVRSRAGLTLIEVLLAIVLLGTGVTVLLVSVQRGLGVARRAMHLETARRLAGALDVDHAVDWAEGYAEFQEGSFEEPFSAYRWEREIRPALHDAEIPLYEVTTRILWSDRSRDAGETWVTLRFVPDESGGAFERPAPAQPPAAAPRGSAAPGGQAGANLPGRSGARP